MGSRSTNVDFMPESCATRKTGRRRFVKVRSRHEQPIHVCDEAKASFSGSIVASETEQEIFNILGQCAHSNVPMACTMSRLIAHVVQVFHGKSLTNASEGDEGTSPLATAHLSVDRKSVV